MSTVVQPPGNGVSGCELSPPLETWTSVNTTRPHWFAAGTSAGVLKLAYWTVVGGPAVIQLCVAPLTPLSEFWAMRSGSWPRVVEAPTASSQSASEEPLGNVVFTLPVVGVGRSGPTPIQSPVPGQGGKPLRTQAECRCPTNMRPPLSA